MPTTIQDAPLPFKNLADRRHHIPKQRHRVTNWAVYDAGLRGCGSLTIWFTEAAIAAWRSAPRTTRGGPPHYSSLVWRFGDGAFDRDDVYHPVSERHPDAAVIVPPRSAAVPSAAAEITPTQRDRHLQLIAENGCIGWQRSFGSNWRGLRE